MPSLKKNLAAGVFAALTLGVAPAVANQITVGSLRTDTETGFTTDFTSGRLYTRFDAFNLTYASLLTALAPGGQWAGWSIATADISDQFVAASLGAPDSLCSGMGGPVQTDCGLIRNWSEGNLGFSFQPNTTDFYGYISRTGGVGLVGYRPSGIIFEQEAWETNVLYLDNYKGAAPINYLLYKDVVAVAEPGSVALLGLGVLGITMFRRRQRK